MTDKHYWILKNKIPCRAGLHEYAAWMAIPDNKRVAKTTVGPLWVSTVFLSVDHSFGRDGPPVLFETMIFSDDDCNGAEDYQTRCCTWAEAEKMHVAAVAYAQGLVDGADFLLEKAIKKGAT